MRKNYIYIILFISLLTTSCEKWLTIQPQNEIEKTKLFETEEGFWQALNGVYSLLATNTENGFQTLYGPSTSMQVAQLEYMIGTWTVGSTSVGAKWGKHSYKDSKVQSEMQSIFLMLYKIIANCNTILEYVDKVDFLPSRSYNLIKGECLAIRAFTHFDLIRIWGPMPTNVDPNYTYLPYVTTVSKASHQYHTYEQYMEFLLADLKESERLLKESDPLMNHSCEDMNSTDSFIEDYNRMEFYYRQNHMNYYGACALHARIALWMNDAETAVAYADTVITAKNPNGSLKFTLGSANDVSSNYVTNTNTLHTEHLFSYWQSYYNWEQDWNGANGGYYYCPESQINSLFTDPNDFRLKLFVPLASDPENVTVTKYLCTNDIWIPLIRLSEMYFIIMECGSLDRANTLYQEFCNSRGCAFTELNENNRKNTVLMEYYREFFAEGQTFFANKRMAVKTLMWLSGDMQEAQYVLSIPERESDLY